MPISINEFSAWARQLQDTAVVTNGSGLAAESTKLDLVTRIFCRGTVEKVRGAVLKDFTRALSSKYGASIAQQAVFVAALTSKTALKGRTIAKVLDIADRLRDERLSPVYDQNLRLGKESITRAQIGGLGLPARRHLDQFVRLRAVAVELLGEIPLTQTDCEDFVSRVNDMNAELCDLAHDIPEGIPAEDFKAEIDALVKALTDKCGQSVAVVTGAPLGEVGQQEYKHLWRDVALNAMKSMKGAAAANNDAAAAIERAIVKLRDDAQVQQNFYQSLQMSKDIAEKCVTPFIVNLVKAQLAEGHVRRFRVRTNDVVQAVKAGYIQALAERPWAVIDKVMSASVGGHPVELSSTIRPAENLGRTEQEQKGPIASNYPEGVHGYSCYSADAGHAVNLAVSSLSVGEPGGAKKLAFCGVRHSVHHAWEINDPNARHAANVQRAKEAVIAAFMAKYDIPADHPELPQEGAGGTVEVDLSMTSVALLTPDKARHTAMRGSDKDERAMLRGQTAAWEAVEQTGVEFQYKGKTIRIKPKILKFNFGVNEGAVKLSRVAPELAGGWDRSDEMNKVAFEALEKEARAFIMGNRGDIRMRNAAATLLDQCKAALGAKRERRDSHDAYKVAARIAVLTQIIGRVPCWNCKSGKDRTSEMDVECKFLSALIARGEPIPPPGAKLTAEQKGLFRTIALNGGNFEVQKSNTGLAGFKTGGVASISERLGGSKFRKFHSGASNIVPD